MTEGKLHLGAVIIIVIISQYSKRGQLLNSHNGFHGMNRHPAFTGVLVAILVISWSMLGVSRCDRYIVRDIK
jgi:hypothetical protein